MSVEGIGARRMPSAIGRRFVNLLQIALLVSLMPATALAYERGPYDEARYLMWTEVYADGGETIYCGVEFGSRHSRDLNVEHVDAAVEIEVGIDDYRRTEIVSGALEAGDKVVIGEKTD